MITESKQTTFILPLFFVHLLRKILAGTCLAVILWLLITAFPGPGWAADIRQQVAAANDGDTMIVDDPYLNPEYRPADELMVDKSITLVGSGNVGILVESLALVIAADDVTLDNFDFTDKFVDHHFPKPIINDYQSWNYSLVEANQIDGLVIRNSTFRNAWKATGNGGVLNLQGCTNVVFENCRFLSANAVEGGLAFLKNCDNVQFINCVFESGQSWNYGGLISMEDSTSVAFENCTFKDGRCLGFFGGGISFLRVDGARFENCTFTGNKAEESGGAGYIRRSKNILFSNCRINNNRSTPFDNTDSLPEQFYGLGGGFSIIKSQADFFGTTFSNNASYQGGALIFSASDISIQGGGFTGNTVTGIRTTSQGVSNTVELILMALKLDIQGIIEKIAQMTLTKSLAPDTVVFPWEGHNRQGGRGGAIYTFKTNLSIIGSSFNANSAQLEGGAIYATTPGTQTFTTDIELSTFSNNSAQKGGAIISLMPGITVTDSLFRSNSADAVGGALYSTDQITVRDTGFESNTAALGGAVCAAVIDTRQTFENCTFDSNTANDHNGNGEGGAIFAHGPVLGINDSSSSVLDIKNCLFNTNAAYNGGAISLTRLEGQLTDNTFSMNGALADGGALYNRELSKVKMVRCDFTDNQADGQGGAVFNGYAQLQMKRIRFMDNTSLQKGGAIADDSGHVILKNSLFTGNAAGLMLGSAMFFNATSPCRIDNCTVVANQASATAIRATHLAVVELHNNIITSNAVVENVSDQDITWSNDSVVTATYNICTLPGPGNFPDNANVMIDPLNGDFHLGYGFLWGSLGAVDQGFNAAIATSLDLDGNPRIRDNDGDGTAVVDLGAYEQTHIKIIFADAHPDDIPHGRVDDSGVMDNQPVHQWIEQNHAPDYTSVNVLPDPGWHHSGWETAQRVPLTAADPFYSGQTIYATYTASPMATYDFGKNGYYTENSTRQTRWTTTQCSPLASPDQGQISAYSGFAFTGWSDTPGGTVIVLPAGISQSTTFYAIYNSVQATLMVHPGIAGTLVTDPGGVYTAGTRFDFSDAGVVFVNPDAGYYHIGFIDDIGHLVDLTAFTLTRDTVITAVYAPVPTGILTVTTHVSQGTINTAGAAAQGFTTGSASAMKSAPDGNERVLDLIVPKAPGHFTGFIATPSGNDLTLTAQYTLPVCIMRIMRFFSGRFAQQDLFDGDGSSARFFFEYGTQVDLSGYVLVPGPGYRFAGWVDAQGNPLTLVTITGDLAIFALFEPLQCHLTLQSSSNGMVAPPWLHTFDWGDTVLLSMFTATPDEGYVFDHWTDEKGPISGPGFVIHDHTTITAVFSPIQYPLSIVCQGHGTVDGSLAGMYPASSCVPLYDGLAAPESGYVFTGFRDENQTHVDSVIMNQPRQLTALFEPGPLSLSLVNTQGGMVAGDQIRWYPVGTQINLTGIQVSVDPGYEFIGSRDSSFNELTNVLMNDHKIIYAEFNPAAEIPTLNEWGMIILALLMVCATAFWCRRRPQTT